MQASIWLHPWDLEGWEPAAFVARLRALGLDACQLALTYHATRFLLPTHRTRRVFEAPRSALYFPVAPDDDMAAWTPPVAPESAFTLPFLDACQRAGFPVRAWVVLCHQDGLDESAAPLCVTNVYGERYRHALCPSQPQVRTWAAALCAAVARQPGIDAIDLEAASFLGVDHQSAHDKRGVPLPASIAWLLSICVCPACRDALDPPAADDLAARARAAIDKYLREWPQCPAALATAPLPETLSLMLGEALLQRLLDVRLESQRALLHAIRDRIGRTRLLPRLATSSFFAGGKSTLPLSALSGLADGAVVTWLGADLAAIRAGLATLPPPGARSVPLEGGFTLHAPDCRAPEDIDARLDLLRVAHIDRAIAYCYGLASETHLTWLRDALDRRRSG